MDKLSKVEREVWALMEQAYQRAGEVFAIDEEERLAQLAEIIAKQRLPSGTYLQRS